MNFLQFSLSEKEKRKVKGPGGEPQTLGLNLILYPCTNPASYMKRRKVKITFGNLDIFDECPSNCDKNIAS